MNKENEEIFNQSKKIKIRDETKVKIESVLLKAGHNIKVEWEYSIIVKGNPRVLITCLKDGNQLYRPLGQLYRGIYRCNLCSNINSTVPINEQGKCVYVLKDCTGIIKYVGQGSSNRSRQKNRRSKEYLDVLDNGGTIEIIATGLSRNESLSLEHNLIQEYENQLINKIRSPLSNKLIYTELDEMFELSDSSPSGLIWKIDRFSCSKQLKASKGSKVGWFNENSISTGWGLSFKNKYLKCHRVVWVLHNKQDLVDSDMVINHIDGNPLNNSISNLELCSQRDNCLKQTKHPRNTTGIVGIKLHTKRNNVGYIASLTDLNSNRISKYFSISKFGLLPAFALAFKWRESKLLELTNLGLY